MSGLEKRSLISDAIKEMRPEVTKICNNFLLKR